MLPAAPPSALLTILVIDDDPSIVGFLQMLLCDKGNIISASSGVEGLALARSARPDLILLDVVMEDMDGFDVCKTLKADPSTASICILFVTAGDDEQLEVDALECGAVDFIAKPLRPAIVRARVEIQLAMRRKNLLLEEMAHRDGLTQLFNRRYFDERFASELARHRRKQRSLALALIDVDHFKAYNDALGHQKGDDCLREIAASLLSCTRRPGETVSRYGGEEFVAILPDTDADQAKRYAALLHASIAARALPHPASAVHSFVTVSVGIVSLIPAQGVTAHELLNAADQALYAAKRSGRNQSVVTAGISVHPHPCI